MLETNTGSIQLVVLDKSLCSPVVSIEGTESV